jgi:hypothetical protein
MVKKEDEPDAALLDVVRGNLTPVTFAFRQLSVGDTIAAAGFYRGEEGGAQQTRLLYQDLYLTRKIWPKLRRLFRPIHPGNAG